MNPRFQNQQNSLFFISLNIHLKHNMYRIHKQAHIELRSNSYHRHTCTWKPFLVVMAFLLFCQYAHFFCTLLSPFLKTPLMLVQTLLRNFLRSPLENVVRISSIWTEFSTCTDWSWMVCPARDLTWIFLSGELVMSCISGVCA